MGSPYSIVKVSVLFAWAVTHWDLDVEALSSGSSSRVSGSGPTSSPHKGNGSISSLLTGALQTQLSPLRKLGPWGALQGATPPRVPGSRAFSSQGFLQSTSKALHGAVLRVECTAVHWWCWLALSLICRAELTPTPYNWGWERERPIRAQSKQEHSENL